MFPRVIAAFFVVAALFPHRASSQMTSGEDVIRAMHQRYAGSWFQNLALVQTVLYHEPGTGTLDSVRVWYESIRLPGTVRSDVTPLDAGNRQVFHEGEWRTYEADSLLSARPGWHPVLLMGFDVYAQPPETTLSTLERFGTELKLLREDEWLDVPVWVVGGMAADGARREFWIEKERLLLVRLVLGNPGTQHTREVLFRAYEPLEGGWIATELEFRTDGGTDILERYDYWTADVVFDPDIFSLHGAVPPGWIRN